MVLAPEACAQLCRHPLRGGEAARSGLRKHTRCRCGKPGKAQVAQLFAHTQLNTEKAAGPESLQCQPVWSLKSSLRLPCRPAYTLVRGPGFSETEQRHPTHRTVFRGGGSEVHSSLKGGSAAQASPSSTQQDAGAAGIGSPPPSARCLLGFFSPKFCITKILMPDACMYLRGPQLVPTLN